MSDLNSSIPAGSRPIPSAHGYRICDGGQVWSNVKPGKYSGTGPWHTIKPRKPTKRMGYIQIALGRKRQCYVHALVLEAFVGPCPPGLECRHLDGDPANNFVLNLMWGTSESNNADKKRHGTVLVGEQITGAKLKRADIQDVFRLSRLGMTEAKIAEIHSVSRSNICLILLRKTWKHVPIPAEYLPRPRAT